MAKEAFKVNEDVVIRGHTVLTKGEVVFPLQYYDDGKADRASKVFGEPHVSISKSRDGKGNALQVSRSALSSIIIDDED